MAWRRETSVGTWKRSSRSTEYSAISAPENVPFSTSGIIIWKTALPKLSENGCE